MELLLPRDTFTPQSCIGDLSIDGIFECHVLEPTARGLNSEMPLDKIQAVKITGRTAIPTGRYKINLYFSPEHNRKVPILLNVPGFEYVEIHVGNWAKDSRTCLLVGTTKATDFVGNSVIAFNKLYPKIETAINNGDEVWITVTEKQAA